MGRVIGGFLFAPFFGIGLFSVAVQSFILGTFALMLAYPIELLFGIPMFILFRQRGWLHWWQVTVGGTLCALPFVVFYVATASPGHLKHYALSNSALLIGCGALIGLVFWGIAIAGNSALEANALISPKPMR
jgi:hypothetical protein